MGLTPPAWTGLAGAATPALVIDLDAVDQNLSATLRLLGDDATRWRPHLKTAKLERVMRRMVERGVEHAKTSTTLELATACRAGFRDVLLAYPVRGAHAEATRRIAEEYPGTAVSGLVEDPAGVAAWRGSRVGLFIDLNPGMNRTGMATLETDRVLELVRALESAGLRFAGLHYYDGHAADFARGEAEALVHRGYDQLLRLVGDLRKAGVSTPEVVTAGTPAFPHAGNYPGFLAAGIPHRVSPGTVVYNDRRSLEQLPHAAGYRPAALVLATVVSHPAPGRFCLDAGHKTVSADAGIPTCEVLGHAEFHPGHPSEEHLPVDVAAGGRVPDRGATLWLLPTHVCPTVNNFDHAIVVQGGSVVGLERVTARGRYAPLEESLRTA